MNLRNKFGRVGLLYGGKSSEREISLMTGAAVHQALLNLGVDVTAIDAGDDLLQQLAEQNLDRVFIALHGPGGEDGTLQGALEYLNLPYTGSGVLASALAMDKMRCKLLWRGLNLPSANFVALRATSDWSAVLQQLGGRAMVKPSREGSSIGMSRVESAEQLQAAWQTAAQYDDSVLAEALLSGPEYTVAILGDQVLPSIRIQAQETFYDYRAKYFSDDTRYHCPSGLTAEKESEIAALARRAFDSLGCRGWGRVDVMADSAGAFQLLEVNTVPGMTSHSLVPMAARVAGISFDQLVLRILEASL